MLKKIGSLFVVFAIVLTISTNAFAIDLVQENVEIYTSDVEIITSPSFNTLIDQRVRSDYEISSVDSAEQQWNATYSYTFEPKEDDSSKADVSLDFVLLGSGVNIPVSLVGDVPSYLLDNGVVLWHGPIRGFVTIHGIPYSVIAGFSKTNVTEGIQATVTIQAARVEDAIDPVVFDFGATVLTPEITAEIFSKRRPVSSPDETAVQLSENVSLATVDEVADEFVFEGSAFGTFNHPELSIPGLAQCGIAHFNGATNRLAIGVKSYCRNIDAYYNSNFGLSTTVIDSYSIQLTRTSDSANGYSYIVGMETYDFGVSSFGTETLLLPLFQDILGLLGVPTALITEAFDSLKGVVERDFYTNAAIVSVQFGAFDFANFDNIDAGTPIVFQLATNNATGNYSYYDFTTSMTYRTTFATGVTCYTDAYDASEDIDIILS